MNRGLRSARIGGLALLGTYAVVLLAFLLHSSPAAAENEPQAREAKDASSAPEARVAPQSPSTAEAPPPSVQQCVEAHERAQVLRIDGKLIESRSALGACSHAACPDPLKHECVTWREEVSVQVPTVIFEALTNEGAAAAASVKVGDRELTGTLDGRALELDPGRYEFRFELPDGSRRVVSAMVKPGDRNVVVSADFRSAPKAPAEPPPPVVSPALPPPTPIPDEEPAAPPVPTASYVLGGISIVSTGIAVGLGMSTYTKEQNARDDCAPVCSQARVDEITTLALLTDISIGVAVGSAVGAALIYAFSRDETREPMALEPSLSYVPGVSARAGIRGWF